MGVGAYLNLRIYRVFSRSYTIQQVVNKVVAQYRGPKSFGHYLQSEVLRLAGLLFRLPLDPWVQCHPQFFEHGHIDGYSILSLMKRYWRCISGFWVPYNISATYLMNKGGTHTGDNSRIGPLVVAHMIRLAAEVTTNGRI